MRRDTRPGSLTGNRILYGFTFLLSLLFHLFWSNTLSALIFYSIVLLPICSLLLTIIFFYRLNYSQRLSVKEAVKYETFEYSVVLVNKDPVHYHPLKMTYYSGTLIESDNPFPPERPIPPLNNQFIQFRCFGRCRGEFPIGIKKIQMTDYFNLFSFSFKRRDNLKIKILPRKIIPDNCLFIEGDSSKGGRSRQNLINQTRERDEINHFRPYVPGDSLRKINWKKSAQTGEFIIRHNETLRTGKVRFILDLTRYSPETEELLLQEDILIETCLALGLYFIRKNFFLELFISGNEREICYNGISSGDRFYRDLALIPFRPELSLPHLKKRKTEETLLCCFTSRNPSQGHPLHTILSDSGSQNFLIYPEPPRAHPKKQNEQEPETKNDIENDHIPVFKEKSVFHILINPSLNIKKGLENLRI